MSDVTATGSVIHDIGYQRYAGPRLGRGYAARSLFGHSLRTAYGIGRGFKAKLFPWSVAAVVMVAATVFTAIASQEGQRPATYPQFIDGLGPLSVLFLAVVAPELASRDLRAKLLPLYFSRPLRRADYVLAKFGALVAAVWLLFGGALLLIFAGSAFDAGSPGRIWREFTDLLGGLLYVGLYAIVGAAIALLVSSLTGRRAFAAGGIVAVHLVSVPVVSVLAVVGGEPVSELAGLLSPTLLVQGTGSWVFDDQVFNAGRYAPVYAVVTVGLVLGCLALLMARYRRVEV